MSRKLFAAAALALVCGAVTVAADDAAPGKGRPGGKFAGKVDKGAMFDKMDADGDGKVTKAELEKFFQGMQERLKAAGKEPKFAGKGGPLGEKMFEKLDADGDGKISKAEFEKAEFGGRPGGFKGGEKKKPAGE